MILRRLLRTMYKIEYLDVNHELKINDSCPKFHCEKRKFISLRSSKSNTFANDCKKYLYMPIKPSLIAACV